MWPPQKVFQHTYCTWGWNKTRTSKVSAISKAQKAQNIFFWKKLEIFEKKYFKKSHSAEKCKRGTLLDLLTYIPLQNTKKLEGGPFGDIEKFSKKVAQCRKKTQRGDPIVSSGFVGFLEKEKNERGTLWTKFALAGLGLRWFQDCF